MMQGDQYRIPISLTNDNGDAITQNELRNLEVFVGKTRKTLADGSVTFEESDNLFYVYITQKESFMMTGDVKVQARLLFNSEDVIGVNLGTVNFETATSKVVL